MLAKIAFSLGANLGKYGYAAVFIGVMLENAGIPIPGETLLLGASALASGGKLSILLVAMTGAAGAIIGDNIGFSIGRFGGRPLVTRYGRHIFIDENHLNSVDSFFNRWGALAVFLARFLAGARVLAALVAGTSHMSWVTFLVFNALGAVVWASAVSLVGFYGAAWGRQLLPMLRSVHLGIYTLIPIIAILWVVLRRMRASGR